MSFTVLYAVLTLLALIIAVPGAYAMAFFPGKRTKDLLLWMLSTKMMPAVGGSVPIYLIFRRIAAIDRRRGLIIVYTGLSLSFATLLARGFFAQLPPELEEAALVDGLSVWGAFLRIVLPTMPDASVHFQDLLLVVAVFSILYGSVLAFSQSEPRLVVAYSSIAQLGFIVLGIFALDDLGAASAWGRAHRVPVFSDECYVEFTWDGRRQTILEHGLEGRRRKKCMRYKHLVCTNTAAESRITRVGLKSSGEMWTSDE